MLQYLDSSPAFPLKGLTKLSWPTSVSTKRRWFLQTGKKKKKQSWVLEVVESEEDFEVFDRTDLVESSYITPRSLSSTQVNNNEETSNIPEAMVLKHKNTNLLDRAAGITCKWIHTQGGNPSSASNSSSFLHFPCRAPIRRGRGKRKVRRHPKRARSHLLRTRSLKKG